MSVHVEYLDFGGAIEPHLGQEAGEGVETVSGANAVHQAYARRNHSLLQVLHSFEPLRGIRADEHLATGHLVPAGQTRASSPTTVGTLERLHKVVPDQCYLGQVGTGSARQTILVGTELLEDEYATTSVQPNFGNLQLALYSSESSAIASFVVGRTGYVRDNVIGETIYIIAEVTKGVTGWKPSLIRTGDVNVQIVVVHLGHQSGMEVEPFTSRYSSLRRYVLLSRSQCFLPHGSPEGTIPYFDVRREKILGEDLKVLSEGLVELALVLFQYLDDRLDRWFVSYEVGFLQELAQLTTIVVVGKSQEPRVTDVRSVGVLWREPQRLEAILLPRPDPSPLF